MNFSNYSTCIIHVYDSLKSFPSLTSSQQWISTDLMVLLFCPTLHIPSNLTFLTLTTSNVLEGIVKCYKFL